MSVIIRTVYGKVIAVVEFNSNWTPPELHRQLATAIGMQNLYTEHYDLFDLPNLININGTYLTLAQLHEQLKKISATDSIELSVVTSYLPDCATAFINDSPNHSCSEEMLKFLSKSPNNLYRLRFISPEFKADHAFIHAAVQRNGGALQYASNGLRGNREIVLVALRTYGTALRYATDELKRDRDFVLKALRVACCILFIAPDLKKDRALMLAAVRQNGNALESVAHEFKSDRDIVLAAVRQNGQALRHAADELRGNKEVVFTAMQSSPDSIAYASSELKADDTLVLDAKRARHPTLPSVGTWLQRLSPRL